mmetsp:Transcript_86399/g.150530  ORF Transcript_86399/g.150530 Transcript_86399/m.150530 type:complete len:109 (-) Transcript_86399:991-1317(-)
MDTCELILESVMQVPPRSDSTSIATVTKTCVKFDEHWPVARPTLLAVDTVEAPTAHELFASPFMLLRLTFTWLDAITLRLTETRAAEKDKLRADKAPPSVRVSVAAST